MNTDNRFVLNDEVRKLIVTTSTLMIVAGLLHLIAGAIGFFRDGMSASGLAYAAMFGVVPAFVLFAGVRLRGVARSGDDLGAVLGGVRQLFVAFFVKGLAMLLVVGATALMFVVGFLGASAYSAGLFR